MRLKFDDIANQFDSQRSLPRKALKAWMALVQQLTNGQDLRIVEPGIGTGRVALPLAAMGHHITGTDISGPMLDACEETARKLNIPDQVQLIRADAIDLPYDDQSFDLGIVAQLHYLVPDWPTVPDELARVVKPGGHIIHLTEPTTEGDALKLWSMKWREMIESTGYQHTDLSPTDDEVHAEFLRRWPDVEVRELANWGFGQTVAEAMAGYAERVRPLYSSVPEAEFNHAVTEFLCWAEEIFPNGEIQLDGTVTLTAVIAST